MAKGGPCEKREQEEKEMSAREQDTFFLKANAVTSNYDY